MWPYLVMFVVPAAVAALEKQPRGSAARVQRLHVPPAWLFVGLALTIIIGCRFEVGGDWNNYLKNLDEAAFRDFYETITWSDPGYRVIEWVMVQFDLGIVGVNLVCALVFSCGLVIFCCTQPRPWLALAVAVPYLVIIVGMGYTRQGMAIGCAMIGLVALQRQNVRQFFGWLLLAATFHKSAILLMPIPILTASKQRFWVSIAVLGVTLAAYALLLKDSVETLSENYIDAGYESEGALIRLVMNTLPALIFLPLKQRFRMNAPQTKLWTWFSVISLLLLAAYFVSPSSTAVDRVALYMLPLQLAVFSCVPEVLSGTSRIHRSLVAGVLLYYACVELVWLNFGTNASYWLPYRFYLGDGF